MVATSERHVLPKATPLWGSISYAFKAPDIPPIKLKTWREPRWDHPKAGESEAGNNICMCVHSQSID